MNLPSIKTVVIFRKFDDGDIIAMFPEDPGTLDPCTCSSYQQTGQHGAASITLAQCTKPASPAEYADLKQELESLGYNLEIKLRFTAMMTANRIDNLKTLTN